MVKKQSEIKWRDAMVRMVDWVSKSSKRCMSLVFGVFRAWWTHSLSLKITKIEVKASKIRA